MAAGTIAAAAPGYLYLAISFLLHPVRTSSYGPFAYHRHAAGVAVLPIIATGLRPATLSALFPQFLTAAPVKIL